MLTEMQPRRQIPLCFVMGFAVETKIATTAQNQQEQNVQRDEAAGKQQQSLPHHKAREVYIYNYRRERQQKKQKDQS